MFQKKNLFVEATSTFQGPDPSVYLFTKNNCHSMQTSQEKPFLVKFGELDKEAASSSHRVVGSIQQTHSSISTTKEPQLI